MLPSGLGGLEIYLLSASGIPDFPACCKKTGTSKGTVSLPFEAQRNSVSVPDRNCTFSLKNAAVGGLLQGEG